MKLFNRDRRIKIIHDYMNNYYSYSSFRSDLRDEKTKELDKERSLIFKRKYSKNKVAINKIIDNYIENYFGKEDIKDITTALVDGVKWCKEAVKTFNTNNEIFTTKIPKPVRVGQNVYIKYNLSFSTLNYNSETTTINASLDFSIRLTDGLQEQYYDQNLDNYVTNTDIKNLIRRAFLDDYNKARTSDRLAMDLRESIYCKYYHKKLYETRGYIQSRTKEKDKQIEENIKRLNNFIFSLNDIEFYMVFGGPERLSELEILKIIHE